MTQQIPSPTPFIWGLSLTGADDGVDPLEMARLSERRPFIEWAILLSPALAGAPRFPTPAWRAEFESLHLNSAAHLCGKAIELFSNRDDNLLRELESFARVQLNFSARRMKPERLGALAKAVEAHAREGSQKIIIQIHNGNQGSLPLFSDLPNTQFLFDGSGGKGIAPNSWSSPVAGWECGYAGGLDPETLLEQIEAIQQVSLAQRVWIDMESRLRVEERFDLGKARLAATIAQPFAIAPVPGAPSPIKTAYSR